jgi:hypothetical protein
VHFGTLLGRLTDCTHIEIQCPAGENAPLLRNRKDFSPINVQAVSGPDLELQNIVLRWPGSVHDSRIFKNSRLCAQFEYDDIQEMLLRDNVIYQICNLIGLRVLKISLDVHVMLMP